MGTRGERHQNAVLFLTDVSGVRRRPPATMALITPFGISTSLSLFLWELRDGSG